MFSSSLFTQGTSSEEIVKMTLLVQHANYNREADRTIEAIQGIDEAEIKKLAGFYDELLAYYSDQGKALAHLTKHIASLLDGSDCPMPSNHPGLQIVSGLQDKTQKKELLGV